MIGACIGEGNFAPFFYFLVLISTFANWALGTSIYFLVVFWSSSSKAVIALNFLLVLAAGFVGLNTTLMMLRYCSLVARGYTHREDVKREQLYGPFASYNPFDNGCGSNCNEMLCCGATMQGPDLLGTSSPPSES